MACSRYDLFYGTGGVLSASYLNCGDETPFQVTVTGGVSGDRYGQVIATTGTLVTYTGFSSAGGAPVPGFVYPTVLKPWILYTYAVSPTGAQFVPLSGI